jgi:hypothetical protein
VRPNLNKVLDTLIGILPPSISTPIQVYLTVYEDGSFCISDEPGGDIFLLLTVGTSSRKMLRKYIKDTLDVLELRLNDKRRTRRVRTSEASSYREDD